MRTDDSAVVFANRAQVWAEKGCTWSFVVPPPTLRFCGGRMDTRPHALLPNRRLNPFWGILAYHPRDIPAGCGHENKMPLRGKPAKSSPPTADPTMILQWRVPKFRDFVPPLCRRVHTGPETQQTKGKGMLMFFMHLSTGHEGIVRAMATEPIPVRATFLRPVSSVTVSFWGSAGTPALLEAFDAEGKVVDSASLESVPGRKAPGDPGPIFSMTVKRAASPTSSSPAQEKANTSPRMKCGSSQSMSGGTNAEGLCRPWQTPVEIEKTTERPLMSLASGQTTARR